MSYLLSLIEKFDTDKDSLPKKDNMFGEPEIKTTYLIAWIKRNDTKYNQRIIDDWYKYGKYNFFGCERYIQSNAKGAYDYYKDLVDEVFRRQLIECEKEERKYFERHDEYTILIKKLCEQFDRYRTTFGAEIWFGTDGVGIGDYDRRRSLTIEELKELLSKYEQIDTLIEKLTKETHIVYWSIPNDNMENQSINRIIVSEILWKVSHSAEYIRKAGAEQAWAAGLFGGTAGI